jgi:putative toxin-antitoxin system antitoxin component (TIGR02293 family)
MAVYLLSNGKIDIMTFEILSDQARGIKAKSSNDYISISRKGLTVKQLKEILNFTGIDTGEITRLIALSSRQFARYTNSTVLKRNISAHLIQILELYKFGYEVFEDKTNFQTWMKTKIRTLNYERPIDLLDTPFGINDVKTIIGRIEHGVFA